MQVLVPIQEHTEMAFNMVLLADRLNADLSYKNEFIEAFSDSATSFTITRAIAQYERTLVSSDAPLDAYIAGTDDAISDEAKKGLALFYGKANCSHCHSGPLFTDFGFYNNGTAVNSNDYGRAELTLDSSDLYTFKVPSLRHVNSTSPYMHDGSLVTLRDVLNQYNAGGVIHDYVSEWIEPLNLNDKELVDLEEFLKTL
jgi:cytochrome c peroxidase